METDRNGLTGAGRHERSGERMLEANDERQLQHRYIQTEVMAELTPPLISVVPHQISTVAA